MTSSPSAEAPPAAVAGVGAARPAAAVMRIWPGFVAAGFVLASGLVITAFGTTADVAEAPAETVAGPVPVAPPAELQLAPAEDEAAGGPEDAPAAAAATRPEVLIRSGRHPSFERFVFDWPETVAFTVEQSGSTIVIHFARPARFIPDASVPADRLVILDATTVQLTAAAADVQSFSLTDHRVVVDLYAADGAARASTAALARGVDGADSAANEGGLAATTAATPPTATGSVTAAAADPADAADTLVPLGLLRTELYRRDMMIASLLARLEAVERGGPGSRGAALPPPQAMLDDGLAVAAGSAVDGATNGESVAATDTVEPAAGSASQDEPDEIERALERTLTQAGVLLLRPGQLEIEPALAYTRRQISSPAFVSNGDAGVIFIGEDMVERDEVRASVDLKVGLPLDSQVEVSLPFNYVDQSLKTMVGGTIGTADDGSGQAFGNPRFGLAKTLMREKGWWPDIVARGYWDSDLGRSTDNGVQLTGNFNEFGLNLSAVKRQDPLAFVGGVGYATVLEKDDVEPGDTWSFTAAAVLAASPATSLRLGFTQQFSGDVEVDGEDINGSDSTSGVLTIGASAVLGQHSLVDVALDVGLTDDAPDYVVRLAVPIRFDLPLP